MFRAMCLWFTGTAVGAVAAQSIGEPGTQMTLYLELCVCV